MGGWNSFLRTNNGGGSTLLTGVTENASIAGRYEIYPNPTKDVVNIPYIEGLERVELFDLKGALIQNFFILSDSRSVNKINLSRYEAGTYIFKLIMKNGEVFIRKVVKL